MPPGRRRRAEGLPLALVLVGPEGLSPEEPLEPEAPSHEHEARKPFLQSLGGTPPRRSFPPCSEPGIIAHARSLSSMLHTQNTK